MIVPPKTWRNLIQLVSVSKSPSVSPPPPPILIWLLTLRNRTGLGSLAKKPTSIAGRPPLATEANRNHEVAPLALEATIGIYGSTLTRTFPAIQFCARISWAVVPPPDVLVQIWSAF